MTTMQALLEANAIDPKCSVETCINGQEAVERIKDAYNHDIMYSLIFMDFSMPVMNGIDATMNIRKHLTEQLKIPRANQPTIIGVTGHV